MPARASKKAAGRPAAVKKAAAAAAVPAADLSAGSASDGQPVRAHRLSVGKSRRLRAADMCPGGNRVTDPQTGACTGDCASADSCTVARFAAEG